MLPIERGWLMSRVVGCERGAGRYGFAVISFCLVIVAQKALELAIGFPHSFLLFYPTILIVAFLAGFRPWNRSDGPSRARRHLFSTRVLRFHRLSTMKGNALVLFCLA